MRMRIESIEGQVSEFIGPALGRGDGDKCLHLAEHLDKGDPHGVSQILIDLVRVGPADVISLDDVG